MLTISSASARLSDDALADNTFFLDLAATAADAMLCRFLRGAGAYPYAGPALVECVIVVIFLTCLNSGEHSDHSKNKFDVRTAEVFALR